MPGNDPVAANSGRGGPKSSPKKGRAATPAPLSGATDTSEAAEHAPAAAPAALPSGAAAGVEFPVPDELRDEVVLEARENAVAELQSLVAGLDGNVGEFAVNIGTGGPIEIDLSGQASELRPVVAVMSHVNRWRAGRFWTAGQAELFCEGDLTDAQLEALRADSGFTMKAVDGE